MANRPVRPEVSERRRSAQTSQGLQDVVDRLEEAVREFDPFLLPEWVKDGFAPAFVEATLRELDCIEANVQTARLALQECDLQVAGEALADAQAMAYELDLPGFGDDIALYDAVGALTHDEMTHLRERWQREASRRSARAARRVCATRSRPRARHHRTRRRRHTEGSCSRPIRGPDDSERPRRYAGDSWRKSSDSGRNAHEACARC